jgi:hypothetical protein
VVLMGRRRPFIDKALNTLRSEGLTAEGEELRRHALLVETSHADD